MRLFNIGVLHAEVERLQKHLWTITVSSKYDHSAKACAKGSISLEGASVPSVPPYMQRYLCILGISHDQPPRGA